jgi:hypothetical protein
MSIFSFSVDFFVYEELHAIYCLVVRVWLASLGHDLFSDSLPKYSKMSLMVLQAVLLVWLSAERREMGEEEFSLKKLGIREGMRPYDL